MNSCIKRLHSELQDDEYIELVLRDDYRLTVKKTDKISTTGGLLIKIRNGKRTVINTSQILFAYTKMESDF